MKSIKNISKFAREQELTRQTVQHRIKAGWRFGELDGVKVMYNPKFVDEVKGCLESCVSLDGSKTLDHDMEVINSFANEVCGDCKTTFQNTLSFEAANYIEKMRMKG